MSLKGWLALIGGGLFGFLFWKKKKRKRRKPLANGGSGGGGGGILLTVLLLGGLIWFFIATGLPVKTVLLILGIAILAIGLVIGAFVWAWNSF